MESKKIDLVEICTVQGDLAASVLKTHLESEGIPVLLKYESIGRILGIIADGLGMVRMLVPAELAEQAKEIIKPRDIDSKEV